MSELKTIETYSIVLSFLFLIALIATPYAEQYTGYTLPTCVYYFYFIMIIVFLLIHFILKFLV